MRCRKVQRNLSSYLDRELELRAAKKLEAHLAGCPRCREKLAALERMEKALEGFPGREPSPFLWTRVQSGLRPVGPQDRRVKAWSKPLRLVPIPARVALVSLFLAVVLVGVIFSLRKPAVRPQGARAEIAVAENLDLLENYELIKNLDLLENWEGKS